MYKMIQLCISCIVLLHYCYCDPVEVNTFPLYFDNPQDAGHQNMTTGGHGVLAFFEEQDYLTMRLSSFNPVRVYKRSLGVKLDDPNFSAVRMSASKILFLGKEKTFILNLKDMKVAKGPLYKATSAAGATPRTVNARTERGYLIDRDDLIVCGSDKHCETLTGFASASESTEFKDFPQSLNSAKSDSTMFFIEKIKCIASGSTIECHRTTGTGTAAITRWTTVVKKTTGSTTTMASFGSNPLVVVGTKSGTMVPLYIGKASTTSVGGIQQLELKRYDITITTAGALKYENKTAGTEDYVIRFPTEPKALTQIQFLNRKSPSLLVGRCTDTKVMKLMTFDDTKHNYTSNVTSTKISYKLGSGGNADRMRAFYAKTTRTEKCLENEEAVKYKADDANVRCESTCTHYHLPKVECTQRIGGSMCMCKNGTFRLHDAAKADHLKCIDDKKCASNSGTCTDDQIKTCSEEKGIKCQMQNGLKDCKTLRKLVCGVNLCSCKAEFYDFTKTTKYTQVTKCEDMDSHEADLIQGQRKCNSDEVYHSGRSHCESVCRYHEDDNQCHTVDTDGCTCKEKWSRKYPGDTGSGTCVDGCSSKCGTDEKYEARGGCEHRCRDKDNQYPICAQGRKPARCVCNPGTYRTEDLRSCVHYDECY